MTTASPLSGLESTTAPISNGASQSDETPSDSPQRDSIVFLYRGTSMWPYFQTGDLLTVKTVPPGKLRKGDCVVYRFPDNTEYIVHRIVAIKPVIYTRGDNRSAADDRPVTSDSVMGRVETRIRLGHVSRTPGGAAGMMMSWLYRYAGKIDPSRQTRGGKVARLIQFLTSGFIARWPWHLHIITSSYADGRQVKHLLLRKRVIGLYKPEQHTWMILWPYCLWIRPPRA
jgi:signal peptidase I